MKTWNFDDILAPVKTEDFLTRMLGKSCLHLRGSPEKFSSLLSWGDINRILCRSGLDLNRVLVPSHAGDLPAEHFCRNALSGFPCIRVPEVNELLADGAVLAINAAEDLHEPILEFCRAIERSLGVPVQAQIRCSCRATNSEAHSYDHDIFVFQLLGGSGWHLRRNDSPRTVPDDTNGSTPSALDLSLNPGDLLYIPRGRRHSNRFLIEPAVSITVIFKNPTGVELTARLFDRLKETEIVRYDVPRFASDEVQATYLTALQAEIIRICTEPGLLLGFMKDLWSISEPTRSLSLPWSGIRGLFSLPEHLELGAATRFPHQDTLTYSEQEDTFEIVHEGNRIRLDHDSGKIMDSVLNSGILSVAKLSRSSSIPAEQLLMKLSEIIRRGLIIAREPAAGSGGNPHADSAPRSQGSETI